MDQSQLYCGYCGAPECHAKNATECQERDNALAKQRTMMTERNEEAWDKLVARAEKAEAEVERLKCTLNQKEEAEEIDKTPFVRISRDDDYREDDDDAEFGTFVAGHRRINLGDLNGDEGEEFMADLEEGALKIAIYAYEHGDIALSTSPFSCPWDSGQVGWWVFTSNNLVEIYGADTEDTRQKATAGVEATVSFKNDIYSGNVWGFEIGEGKEVSDSCWGFVGDMAPESMKEHIPDNLHASLDTAWEARFD